MRRLIPLLLSVSLMLVTGSAALDPDALVEHAETLGLELPAFRQCFDSGKYAAAVRDGIAEGQRLRVTATPTFLLGGTDPESETLAATRVLVGAKPASEFVAAITALLEGQE